jgi:hypothetical protein
LTNVFAGTPSLAPPSNNRRNLVFRKPIAVSKYRPVDDRVNALISPLENRANNKQSAADGFAEDSDGLLSTKRSSTEDFSQTSGPAKNNKGGSTSSSTSSFSKLTAEFKEFDEKLA